METDKFKENENQIQNDQIPGKLTDVANQEKVPSTTSVKSKKSSNLLSAFVRRRRNKNKSIIHLNPARDSSPNLELIASNSSLGIHTEEEVEINVENYESFNQKHDSKCNNKQENSTDSEHSLINNIRTKHPFFLKFMKKQSATENEKKKSEQNVIADTIEIDNSGSKRSCKLCNICDNNSNETIPREQISSKEINSCVPTCYINFGKPSLNITLANGLQLVQELGCRLQESENHFIQIFGRYIKDASFQRELVDTLNQHSKLQWETERRTSTLANDMWVHQIEIGRAQERTLQDTLNSLVKQNRHLQIDNETLFRKNERLIRKLRSSPDLGIRHKCIDCDSQINHIVKHNEQLQYKLEAFCGQIEHLENELQVLQKQNENLEQQLRNSFSQMESLKANQQRSKADYELEIVTLNHNILSNEAIIKEAVEAGDILLEDVESIKRQTKRFALSINWSKFKGRGNILTDLIHLCRSYVNELSKEVINLCTQLNLREKDIESLQETNTKLQENLKKSTTELDSMSKRFDDNSFREAEKIISEQKNKLLETDLKIMQEKMENQKIIYEMEMKTLTNKLEEYRKSNEEILEKDKMIEQTKVFIGNITSENITLRNQIDGLNKILAESGAGDVVKELSKSQDQLNFFQNQYYQLLNEKQSLLEQQEMLRNDNKIILEHQETNYKHLQKQLRDLDSISKENSLLRQQIETEHQTVLSLQNERMKYLEEKNMLKAIFQHMKAEIARVQKLEGTVSDISKEASKLAMIAEYNKQLGEKLKSELHEKDKTILQLKTSVEKLNEVQLQNTKEKLSLCYELSEVNQMKEQLNNILSMEIQKNLALDDSKKELVESASNQLRKYEELQKNERNALKDLLRDFKSVVNQRDNLIKEKEKLQQEIAELKAANSDRIKGFDNIVFAKSQAEIKLRNLIQKKEEDQIIISRLKEKLTSEVTRYNGNLKQLEKLIVQLREEKEQLDNSVKYLQNNIQKLHNDLNESRKNEKESKDSLNKYLLEKEAIIKEKTELQRSVTLANDEKEKLTKEVDHLNSICEKILADYESSIKSSMEKEELFRKELDESKKMLINNAHEIEKLTGSLYAKQESLRRISEECEQLKLKERHYMEVIKAIENSKMEFIETKNKKVKYEKELADLQAEHTNTKIQLDNMRQEADSLQKQLTVIIAQKEEEYVFYKKHMDEALKSKEEIHEKQKSEIDELKLHLNDVSQKLENERSSYAALSQIHKEVSAKFIKSIKDVVDEKNSKQEAVAKMKEMQNSFDDLKTEKADLQQQVNVLLDGLNDSKNRINTLTQEKDNIQSALDDLQKRYNELLKKCLSLENEIRIPELQANMDPNQIKDQVETLRKEFQENNNTVFTLKQDITKLQQQITSLEFQKSEVTLRLHETQRKLETEQNLCEQLKNTHRLVLASVLKLKEEGKVDSNDWNYLLHMVQSNSSTLTEDDSNR